jgi:O-antigen/teichoic acid export membrane protein
VDKAPVVDQASRSVKWAALGTLLPKLVTPVVTLVLAALLTPADFGIVAAALAVVSFGQIVVEMGMGAAVVQRRTQVFEAASLALFFSVTVGLALYAVLWIMAPTIARVYDIGELQSALRVVGISLVLSALISVPTALLTRELQFQRLFWIGALPQIANALVSLALALAGGGYWALIGGYLSGRVLNLVLVWKAGRWRPKPVFDRQLFRSLFVFSVWIFVSGLQSWLFLYSDNLLAGYFYGANYLGVYSLGFNLAMLLPGMLIAPLASVAYPAFCAIQDSPQEVGRSLNKLQSFASAILFPACFGLAAVAPPIVSLLYGTKWLGLGWTLGVLSIMPGISNLWSLNADAYRSVGRPDVWTKTMALALCVLFPSLIIGGQFSYPVFVLARFVGALSVPIIQIWAAKRLLRIPISDQWRSWRIPAALAVLMFGVVLALSWFLQPFSGTTGWLKLIMIVATGALFYIVALWRADRALFNGLTSSIRSLSLRDWS